MLHVGFLCGEPGLLFFAGHELPIVVASLVNRAQALGAQTLVSVAHGLQSAGLVAVTLGLSCPMVCGNFLDQGSHQGPLQADSLPLDHQGSLVCL